MFVCCTLPKVCLPSQKDLCLQANADNLPPRLYLRLKAGVFDMLHLLHRMRLMEQKSDLSIKDCSMIVALPHKVSCISEF